MPPPLTGILPGSPVDCYWPLDLVEAPRIELGAAILQGSPAAHCYPLNALYS